MDRKDVSLRNTPNKGINIALSKRMDLKSILTLSAVAFLTLASPKLAEAQTSVALQCASLFNVDAVNIRFDFNELAETNQFQNLMKAIPRVPAPLWRRYWKDPVTYEIQRHLMQKIDGESQRFEVVGEGDFITRTLVMDDHLFLDLVHIRTYEKDAGVGLGKRAHGMNSLFVKTMTAFLKAASALAADRPEIKTVIIKGINLKNPMLIEFLKENGFDRADLHSYSKEFEKAIQLDAPVDESH